MKLMHPARALACLSALALTLPAHAEFLAPNANLMAQGIPAIPLSLVRDVEKYTDFRGHSFVDWHPKRAEMLISYRAPGANTSQLYRLGAAQAKPEALTTGADPVSSGRWEPRDGNYLVFSRSPGGNEAYQLYRLDPTTRQETLLTNVDERHSMLAWMNQRSVMLVGSVPLDRTAQGGTRANPGTTISIVDPLKPDERRKLVELPGPGWFGGVVSPDDKHMVIVRYRSANESEVWHIDLESGARRQLLPAAGETLKAAHYPSTFSRDGKALFFVSDRAGEFLELMRLDLATSQVTRLSAHIPWNVEGVDPSFDGRTLALRVNVDGRKELRLFDTETLKERAQQPAWPAGNVGNSVEFHRATGHLAFNVNSSQGPSQIHAMDIASGRAQRWTSAESAPGVDMSTFVEQRVVRWKSFDGLTISGILNLPPARFTGKRPVLVMVHGGPEAQATMGFLGRWNYLLNELGIAVLQPNVRGSSGYGKTFLALDNGMKREDSVKDMGAMLDWIATQPNLDAKRVLITGGSYGGYMALAAGVHYSDRIAGAINVVGISNFVSFLNNTESYRRDLRRVEYGDERDPAMRAFLENISPLTQAHRIKAPLFVVHGKNDPRVPVSEAEQIVAKVRTNGSVVWYLRADNEGHGFARKENADFQFYATLMFLKQALIID